MKIIFNSKTPIPYPTDIKPGSLVVVRNALKDKSPIGMVLIRTDHDEHPFLTLETGELWGDSLDNYTFEEVNDYEFIIN